MGCPAIEYASPVIEGYAPRRLHDVSAQTKFTHIDVAPRVRFHNGQALSIGCKDRIIWVHIRSTASVAEVYRRLQLCSALP